MNTYFMPMGIFSRFADNQNDNVKTSGDQRHGDKEGTKQDKSVSGDQTEELTEP
jgi:hypothetical protein